MKILAAFVICLVVMLLLDGLWLAVIAKNFYRSNLGHLLAEKPNWLAAVCFYLTFCVGILYFAVSPELADYNSYGAALKGALFGFFAYATYDLTNQATMRDWPYLVTLADLAWGSALTGTVSWATVTISKCIFPVA
jgi:uncharacterized membrane protein